MKIYDFTDAPYLNKEEKLIINMNAAVLTFHTEKDILTFRNTHLNWLLLYDLKLDDCDYMHARMAYNAYGDIVSVKDTISTAALHNLMIIRDFCHGDLLMDLSHCADVNSVLLKADHAGIRYIIGAEHPDMITCTREICTNDDHEEEI